MAISIAISYALCVLFEVSAIKKFSFPDVDTVLQLQMLSLIARLPSVQNNDDNPVGYICKRSPPPPPPPPSPPPPPPGPPGPPGEAALPQAWSRQAAPSQENQGGIN